MDVSQHSATQPRAPLTYWLCQLSGWGLWGLAEVGAATQILRLPVARTVLEVALLAGLGVALTHGLRAFLHRCAWVRLPLPVLVLQSLAMALVLSLPAAALTHYLSVAALWRPDPDELAKVHIPMGLLELGQTLIAVVNWTALFTVWTVLYFTISALRDQRSAALRQSELTRALQLSELRLLKSQLNPHFLFNSLNSVRALIADDPTGAQKAVTQLARILRYTLTAGRDELVALERELEIVEDYLALEMLRFGERLRIERHMAPEAFTVRVPVMLLQTVVENAIKHGIAELPAGGDLRISAALRDGTLHVEVQNTRPQEFAKLRRPDGVGLSNAAERLRLLFGSAASLELDLSDAAIAVARIRIPEIA